MGAVRLVGRLGIRLFELAGHAKRSRLFWGGVYFALIPAFAYVYTVFYNDFEFSTLHREPALHEDMSSLRRDLLALTEGCYNENELPFVFVWSVDFEAGQIELSVVMIGRQTPDLWREFRLPSGGGTFEGLGSDRQTLARHTSSYEQAGMDIDESGLMRVFAFVTFRHLEHQAPGQLSQPLSSRAADPAFFFRRINEQFATVQVNSDPVSLRSIGQQSSIVPDVSPYAYYLLIENCISNGNQTVTEVIDRYEEAPDAAAFHSPHLRLPEDLLNDFSRIRSALLYGNDNLEYRYVRMLYFSTVTITTLGYGDTLPVTNRARMLVSLQSVLGILVIGLFINSLTRDPQNDGPME